ncbi:MAG TPA: ABC transporter permease, partial [Planctomycetota bacterium]|nr:ABC transporter permease [Planctomycetota bacterium]
GRSGSAFTAQLGAMKLNDEIDAISTLGLQPMKVLVVPRVLALVLALPLLVGLGNIMGIFGGLLVGSEYLGLSPRVFTDRLQQVLETRHVLVGLVKAPVFASVIAIIGCQMGLSVEKSARSIGLHTTSTVVQAVVAVILLDAGFAVFFEEIGF